MWKIMLPTYLGWYVYTVTTQDYLMDRGNSLEFAFFGGFLAFLICVNYGISIKDWLSQIKKDTVSLRNLEDEVRDLQYDLLEMKLRLGWASKHPAHEDDYIENKDLSNR